MCTNARARASRRATRRWSARAAGAEHLVDKLDGLPFGGAMPPVTEATVVTVLAQCEAKMLRALEAARAKGAERKPPASARERAPARDPPRDPPPGARGPPTP